MTRRASDEGGFSLVELLFTVTLLGVVVPMFLNGLLGMQKTVAIAGGRSDRNDQARLALEQLDRQIRSGDVFYDPALESDVTNDLVPNMALRILTDANAPTQASGARCVQWRISNDSLQDRWWAPGAGIATASAWQTVATSIVNRDTPTVPAFQEIVSSGTGTNLIAIDLAVSEPSAQGGREDLLLTVAGRNTNRADDGSAVSEC